jgi:hypothetical protein
VRTFKPITLLFFLFFASCSYAAVTPDPIASAIGLRRIKIKDIEKITGKKLTLFQKIKFKILQKTLGKWDGGEMTEKQKKKAKLSLIFGLGSIVLLLISMLPFVAILGLLSIPAAITAIVLGAQSLKGNSNSEGIIGVVTGGITLALIMLALIVAIIFLSGFTFE